MRQTLLLNIVVLVFFVLLFYSLYRRRRSERLKFWIAAWIFAVVHFLILFPQATSSNGQAFAGFFALSALMLCGCFFLLSAPVRRPESRRIVGVVLASALVLFAFTAIFFDQARHLLLAINLFTQIAGLIVLWRYHVERLSLKVPGTVLLLVSAQWSSYEILRGQGDAAIYVLLMELFAAYALLFAQEVGRRTAGAITTILGLCAWAAVFPCAMTVAALWPSFVVNAELWNVPKVVVAFGMLVTLLEDEQFGAEREREQYRQLFENNPLPMWIFDPNSMQLLEANGTAVREFGWDRDQLGSLTLSDLVSENETSPVGLVELNWRLAGEDPEVPGVVSSSRLPNLTHADAIRFRTSSGADVVVEATLQRIVFQGRQARLLMAKDITAQVETQEQLIHLANHDPLTGLPNRLLLHDRMKSALATAARHGKKAAIICIDLDRFKQINDTYGHAAGDSCLREVANRLRQRLRAVDTAARTGGEEFMILLDDVNGMQDAERVAIDVLACLSSPHITGDAELRLSASIGIALYPDDGMDPAPLWSMADAAMYRAKQSGGNQYAFFSRIA